jgi:hypothetical protein
VTRSVLFYLGPIAAAGWLGACGECKVVEHTNSSPQGADTTEIAKQKGNCVVHVYAATKSDSVGPKP